MWTARSPRRYPHAIARGARGTRRADSPSPATAAIRRSRYWLSFAGSQLVTPTNRCRRGDIDKGEIADARLRAVTSDEGRLSTLDSVTDVDGRVTAPTRSKAFGPGIGNSRAF